MDKEIENAFINGLNESKIFDEIVEAITDCIYKKIERKLQSIKIYNEWYQLGVKNNCGVCVTILSEGGNYTLNNISKLKIHENEIKDCKTINNYTIKLKTVKGVVYELILIKEVE